MTGAGIPEAIIVADAASKDWTSDDPEGPPGIIVAD
jgi:hypothetical protein